MVLRNLRFETLTAVFNKNLNDFIKLLELSKEMGLTIFRLGSNFIPFASHPAFRPEWFKVMEEKLKYVADVVRNYCIRITMHPDQFVVLNSPKDDVVQRSLAELKYHFWVLDTLKLGDDSVVVIHVGGVYGDKKSAIKRLEETLNENTWLKKRLAIENDEKYYTIDDVIQLVETYGIPAVFDYYHHTLNPSNFSLDKLLHTWGKRVPEIHISSKPEGIHKFGEHGDYINVSDFKNMISMFGADFHADVIIEAKKKEKAASRLLQELKHERIPIRTTPLKCPA